jgi:hypothetical protein
MFNINEKSKLNIPGYFTKLLRGKCDNFFKEESKDAKKFKMFLSRSLKHKYYVSRLLIREISDLSRATKRPIYEPFV